MNLLQMALLTVSREKGRGKRRKGEKELKEEEGAFGEISLRDHLPFPLRSPFLKRKPIAESAATASATDGAKVPSARPCRPHYNISDIPRAGGAESP